MLTQVNVLMLGGDARYLEVINKLVHKNATVYAVGFDQKSFNSPQVIQEKLSSIPLDTIGAITLPVSGTDDKGKITTTYATKDVLLTKELLKQTPDHCTIYSGTANSFLKDLTQSMNRPLITLFSRDDIAILNSIPTAEGTLEIAMEQTDYTIHGSSVIVLGFGRVGMTVARLFSSIGAHVTVCVRSSSDAARIREIGLTALYTDQLKDNIHQFQICINTIPHLIINESIMSQMHPAILIIDLASAPGGTNFEYAKKKGLKAIHALGLPGKVAPKSAGNIIADVICELIKEQIKQ